MKLLATLKNILNINTALKSEPGQIYSVDLTIIGNKNSIEVSDIKSVNLNDLLTSKTFDSYISLESRGNRVYFISTAERSARPKKTPSVAKILNSSRTSLVGSQIIRNQNNCTEDSSTIGKLLVNPSPKNKIRLESSGPIVNTFASFITSKNSDNDSGLKLDSDKKAQVTKTSRFNEYNSEIVNIYRKPLYGKIIRV